MSFRREDRGVKETREKRKVSSTFLQNNLFSKLKIFKKVIFITPGNIKTILKSAVVYMAIPSGLFLMSLPFNISIKIAAITLFLFCIFYAFKNVSCVIGSERENGYYLRLDLFLVFIVFLTVTYAGFFLLGHNFVSDWAKHRGVLLSLYFDPVNPGLNGFMLPQGNIFEGGRMIYYYAMHLPAAYVVRLLSVFFPLGESIRGAAFALSFCFFLWNFLGVVIASLLMPIAVRNIIGKMTPPGEWGYFYLALLPFAGLNYWVCAFQSKKILVGLCDWAAPYFASYSFFITLWQWVPSQLVAGLLGVIFLLVFKNKMHSLPWSLLSVFLICSSTWCWLGILPIICFFVFKSLFLDEKCFRVGSAAKMFFDLIVAMFLTMLVSLFFKNRESSLGFSFNRSLFLADGIMRYFYFLLINLFCVGLIFCLHFFRKKPLPGIVIVTVLMLLVMPLFETGTYNDFVMRCSIPAFLILMMFCAWVIQECLNGGIFEKAIICIFFIIVTHYCPN